jgi:dihydrofolate reductase
MKNSGKLTSMSVSIIAAVADNGAIGKDNDLIWNLPDDMRFFKDMTLGHHVIMGRKNFESIPHRYRPLPQRPNIVITRQEGFVAEGCIVVDTIFTALDVARKANENEAFIIGGGQIYELALELDVVDDMYITHVHASPEADVYFPEFDKKRWSSEIIRTHQPDDRHEFGFEIVHYSRSL